MSGRRKIQIEVPIGSGINNTVIGYENTLGSGYQYESSTRINQAYSLIKCCKFVSSNHQVCCRAFCFLINSRPHHAPDRTYAIQVVVLGSYLFLYAASTIADVVADVCYYASRRRVTTCIVASFQSVLDNLTLKGFVLTMFMVILISSAW